MARIYIESENIEKAKEMIDPLMQRKRLHIDEMAALCSAKIAILLKEGHNNLARSWFGMFEQVCPEHPDIAPLRAFVEGPDQRKPFGGLFGR